jgi:hypothetical protein
VHIRKLLTLTGLLLGFTMVGNADDPSRAGRAPGLSSSPLAAQVPVVERARFGAARFVRKVDNAWWPMAAGTTWRYRRVAGGETTVIRVIVLNETSTVSGVEATVVQSATHLGGELVEVRRDWYAQDAVGNVWQLGTRAEQYADGVVVGNGGSWEAGIDGARAGIVVPAKPALGTAYRHERGDDKAEGRARIVSFDRPVRVPGGAFARTMVAEETIPLDPHWREHRIYARGVGPVLAIDVSPRGGRVELIRFTSGRQGS